MFRLFENLVDPYAPYEETDTPPNRLWPFLRSYMGPFRKVFVAAGIMSVIVALIDIWLVYYLGRVVDLLAGDPSLFWGRHGTELILVAVFVVIVRPMMDGLDVVILNNTILPNFGTLIRWRAHRHVLRQSVGWFENDLAGRIANRVTQTPPAAGEAVFQVFDALTYAIAYIIGSAIMLSEADPRLAIPLAAWLVLYILLIRWTVLRVGPASKASSDARSKVTGRVVDAYSNIHSVKLFAGHDRELEHAREAIEGTRRTFSREMRVFTVMDVALDALNGMLVVGVVGWAILLWSQGSATIGVVAAASTLTLRLNAMTMWIMWAVSSFFRQLGVVAEGMETIAQPIRLVDAPGAGGLAPGPGRIEIEALSHSFDEGAGSLDGVSLVIEARQKVGLVGRSGAGKTTLLKLLARFYDVQHGRILIDGQDIGGVTQDSLRGRIGMVQQESSLLHRSVRDNILYAKPGATEQEMVEAARKAEAHEFIEALRDMEGRTGYDAHVGERGVKLSGGQRQRIVLARVILKDAPLLFLDEATSALDSESEAAIQATLREMMADKTVVAVAHRLSTIARMDRIVVMDQGRIVEDGTHAGLLAKGGLYARFWQRQSGGMLDVDEAAQ